MAAGLWLLGNKLVFYGLMIGEPALVFTLAGAGAINKLSATTATLIFIACSALNGIPPPADSRMMNHEKAARELPYLFCFHFLVRDIWNVTYFVMLHPPENDASGKRCEILKPSLYPAAAKAITTSIHVCGTWIKDIRYGADPG